MNEYKGGDKVLFLKYWEGVGIIEGIAGKLFYIRAVSDEYKFYGVGGFHLGDFIHLTELTKTLV
jgi:hypothetical protein